MLKSLTFIAGCFVGQLVAYAAVELTPKDARAALQCEQPAEVQNLVAVIATMPLAILTTETGTPPVPPPSVKPDAIAALIGGL